MNICHSQLKPTQHWNSWICYSSSLLQHLACGASAHHLRGLQGQSICLSELWRLSGTSMMPVSGLIAWWRRARDSHLSLRTLSLYRPWFFLNSALHFEPVLFLTLINTWDELKCSCHGFVGSVCPCPCFLLTMPAWPYITVSILEPARPGWGQASSLGQGTRRVFAGHLKVLLILRHLWPL